ncbi:MAG: hypothetical protein GY747_08330 [Planctomycetes bacterium]|nr:hypothetical protein [Planctomycetota bacterium]MCP4771190.1 hypothetical protein [Planctomycetota bacterium]MCP4862083.1 hypothetical protein [Planctomycetota bacterium]
MIIRTLIFAGLIAVTGGCSNKVTLEDPEGIEVLSTNFSPTELQAIAQTMTESFTASNAWGTDKPRIVFGGVANRTNQHIDTVNITDTIRTALIQSQKFTVLAGEQGLSEIQGELDYQGAGSVDLASAVELGRQLGAEYVFYGRFTTIMSAGGDVESIYYKFTFNAVNTQTRQIVWADEHQMRKRQEKTLFGW